MELEGDVDRVVWYGLGCGLALPGKAAYLRRVIVAGGVASSVRVGLTGLKHAVGYGYSAGRNGGEIPGTVEGSLEGKACGNG